MIHVLVAAFLFRFTIGRSSSSLARGAHWRKMCRLKRRDDVADSPLAPCNLHYAQRHRRQGRRKQRRCEERSALETAAFASTCFRG